MQFPRINGENWLGGGIGRLAWEGFVGKIFGETLIDFSFPAIICGKRHYCHRPIRVMIMIRGGEYLNPTGL